MRTPGLLLLVFLASSAFGGVRYDFVTTIETSRFTEKASGRVWAQGQSYRAEVVRADGSRHGVVSRDGDVTATIINFQKNTTAPRVRPGGTVRSSSLFVFPVAEAALSGFPQVEYRRGGSTVIAGRRAQEHLIEATFEVMGAQQVGGQYTVVARIWAAEDLPALPMNNAIRTGYENVDLLLQEAVAQVKGMTLRHDLEITRVLHGGEPQVERTSTVVTRVKRMQIPADQFTTP